MLKEHLMRRNLYGGLLVAAAVALSAAEAAAQETGTPMFKAPYRAFTSHEFGGAFSDPGEGVSFALEGFYGYGRGNNDFGLRGGIADPEGEGDTRLLLGGNFRTRVVNYSESFPLDGALTLGAGINLGDGDDLIYLPIGVTLGRRFELENSRTTFTPYAHPVIVPVLGAAGGDDVDFALGLGVDLRFSQNLSLRVSGGVGEIEGVGIGLTYVR
jgi:outer membrane protein with beta-barrel domain